MMSNQVDSINLHEDIINLNNDDKSHPWRRCAKGKHFVKEHLLHGTRKVREHCASNPSHKEELSYEEIQYITKTYFNDLSGPPTSDVLKFPDADTYDCFIRGWTYFWNDIFKPSDLLDPNYIKALIATESGFRKNPPENPHAHGLMQLLHQSFVVLQDTKGELHDYLIRIPWNKLLDPSTNICMGIRWLFQKRHLLEIRLKREVTWEETVIEYKSYWDDINKHDGKMPKGILDLREYYKQLLEG